jgi:hypothetical protein
MSATRCKGAALWPVVLSLMSWGDDFCAPGGPRRLFRHAADGGGIDRWGRCDACGTPVPAPDTIIVPGPGLEPLADGDSRVTAALTRPHRLLDPLRAADTVAAGDDQGLAAQAGGDHRLADEDVGRGD